MRKLVWLAFAAIIFNGCNSSKVSTAMSTETNRISTKQKNDGWKLLFDGNSTKGWHTYGYTTVGNAWNVQDGALHLNVSDKKNWPANETKDIVTDEEYDNFHFKTDWKISTNGNSGIIFYVHEDKSTYRNTYQTGPEMQVLDNNGHPDAKIIKHRAGDLYDLISGSPETVKPAGEWNTAEIISKNGKLDFYLNGTNIISTTIWDDEWRQMIANSKFKSMPGFGTFKKGRIALQEHSDEVWYRNIMIKKL
jgi:hypothetical protein